MRGKNPELYNLRLVESGGVKARLYGVTIPDTRRAQEYFEELGKEKNHKIPKGPQTYYEVFSEDSSRAYLGRVSQAIRCDRV